MAVTIQEELSHLTGARTLLHLLDVHTRDCTAVVCGIGRRSGGGFPTDAEVEPYKHLLPSGMPRAPYTQWEFLLARKDARTLIVCQPRPGSSQPRDIADDKLAAPDELRRVVSIFEASLGAEHPNVATGLNNLALLLRDTNRLAEAEPLMRRMAVIFLRFERDTRPRAFQPGSRGSELPDTAGRIGHDEVGLS